MSTNYYGEGARHHFNCAPHRHTLISTQPAHTISWSFHQKNAIRQSTRWFDLASLVCWWELRRTRVLSPAHYYILRQNDEWTSLKRGTCSWTVKFIVQNHTKHIHRILATSTDALHTSDRSLQLLHLNVVYSSSGNVNFVFQFLISSTGHSIGNLIELIIVIQINIYCEHWSVVIQQSNII